MVDAALSETLDDELAILEVLEDVVGMYRVADSVARRHLHEALFTGIAINQDASVVKSELSALHDRVRGATA